MGYRRRIVLIIFLICAVSCNNPLGGSKNTTSVDPAYQPGTPIVSVPILPPLVIQANFEFDSLTDYDLETEIEIVSGNAQLKTRDVVDDSTVAGTDLNFLANILADPNLTIAANKVTMTSGVLANFESRIMDNIAPVADWTRFNFVSSLPFGKELAASAETGYGLAVPNLSNQLVGLWHLNQAAGTTLANTVLDSSVSANHGSPQNALVFGVPGMFGTAVQFNGVNQQINLAATGFPLGANPRTTAIWFRRDPTAGNRNLMAYGSNANGQLWEMMVYNGHIIFHGYGGGFDTVGVAAPVVDSVWMHAALTYDGTNVTVYLNGVNRGSRAVALTTTAGVFTIGGPGYFDFWRGDLDEAALWNRALTDAEVELLYRRGANRIKFQVRGCVDSVCTGNPTWVGPSGTNSDHFSEMNNNTDPYTFFGTVITTPFAVPWLDLASANAGFSTWKTINSVLPFVQYKVRMESDSPTFFPDLTSASFSPTSAYLLTKPAVKSKLNIAQNFTELTSIAITESGVCAGVHYDLGNDANSFYSWTGTAWTASTSFATANSKATLEALSTTDWKLFPKGSGKVYARAFLDSNGSTTCSVDKITINGLLAQ